MNKKQKKLFSAAQKMLNEGTVIKHLPPKYVSAYYNNKHPQAPITYSGRVVPGNNKSKRSVPTDVRDFITPNNFLIENLIKDMKINNLNNDQKAEHIQQWVMKHIKYDHDQSVHGHNEVWQFPFETLHMGTGDCEDGAILMASMMLAAGIPAFRVRVAGGLVKVDSKTAPTGGHGWCCYLRESDNKWIALDWCYLPQFKLPMSKRKTLKEDTNYIETWFSWNARFSWGRNAFELKNRVRDK